MSKVIKMEKSKKKSKSHTWFLGLLLIIVLICFLLLSPIFNIKKIEVTGNKTVSADYIVSDVSELYDRNILAINKFEIINKINELPVVDNSKLKRKWPDAIHIEINEKEPIAETKFYASKLLLSDKGEVIHIITDNTETGLPLLEGVCVQDVKAGDMLKCKEEEKLKKYLEVLKKLKENAMLNGVVKLSEKDGFLIHFSNGHIVFLGDTDNLQRKMEWLKSILEKEQNPAYIDLHNLDKVVTKPVWGVLNPPNPEENVETLDPKQENNIEGENNEIEEKKDTNEESKKEDTTEKNPKV